MTWQDQLQKGKFRDAEFYTASSDGSIGRRTEVHKYPLRDKPFVEDLGRREREFSLEVYVLGQDYMAARDRLIEAVEKPGPGPLVHHWLGAMDVSVTDCRITESTDRGGFCTFSITFVEAGENTYPAGPADTRIAVDGAADLAIEMEWV
ncbi:MAG: DNA circularization N-terminal domain-containing protein, partial [Methylococcaceae bacterium]|nr:DNA circularization N-terminal domain-containing protein [Methylococcaceae bacterium]